METTERFSNRVENYVKYRPNYPQEVLKLFQCEMNLTTDSIIADIGSGTGISSKIFLENGNVVYGIEPNKAMRNAAETFLKDFPKFQSIDASAENTTLADNSVDFIIAAQAFHWFDKIRTFQEFQRILKKKGFIVLIWNERLLDATPFLVGYEKLLLEFGTDYKAVRHDKINDEVLKDFFQGDYNFVTFKNVQIFDYQGLKGRLLSSSYTPSEEYPSFAKMLEKLKTLFAEHQKNDTIEFLYSTQIYYKEF